MYYIQIQSTPETKEITNALIRRGKEWHGSDRSLADVASNAVTVDTAEPDPRSPIARPVAAAEPTPRLVSILIRVIAGFPGVASFAVKPFEKPEKP
jgi:hypothetical protein